MGWLVLGLSSCRSDLDWTESHQADLTEPYGDQALYDLLPDLFAPQEVLKLNEPLETYLPKELREQLSQIHPSKAAEQDISGITPYNFSFINTHISLSIKDLTALELMMHKGAHVLLCANTFNQEILTYYGIGVLENQHQNEPDTALHSVATTTLITHISGRDQPYEVRSGALVSHLEHQPVGFEQLVSTQDHQLIALTRKVGKGKLIISTAPKLFTNIHLLYYCPDLIASYFQQMPLQKTYWANRYYSANQQNPFEQSDKSILDFVMQYRALKWAFYLILLGAMLYVLSNMKRYTRAIQPLEPKKNMSLAYLDSMSQLYRQRESQGAALHKKIDLFYSYLYQKYGIKKTDTAQLSAQALTKRTQKIELKEAEHLFELLKGTYGSQQVNQQTFSKVFTEIENFKKKIAS